MKYTTLLPAVLSTSLLLFGCSRTPPTLTGQAPTASTVTDKVVDDDALVESLTKAGAKLKQDADGNVLEVDFRGTDIGDEALAKVPELQKVRSLLLNDTNVSDAGLILAGKTRTLTNLDLRGCKVTNAGIASLGELSKLRALRLSGKSGKTDVTDEAMETIGKLKSLKVLAIDFLKFAGGDRGLAKLSGLTDMQELYLGNTLVNDRSIKVIAEQFPKLKKLRAAASQVSNQGIETIATIKDLEELDLSENSQIFDDGMVHFAGMSKLKKLNLWRVQITDEGIKHLSGLTNLEWLNLDNVAYLSDNGLEHLKDLTNLTFLHLGSTAITDQGLPNLHPLTSLKDLKVTRTGVTQEGVDALKKVLTGTEIQLKYIEGQ